jgi:hypothetical protein
MKMMRLGVMMVVMGLGICGLAFGEEGKRLEGSFDSKGVKIAYAEAGDVAGREAVVMVHGLYSSEKMNWEMPGIFAEVAKKYHVVALDLRGHGESDKPTDEAAYGEPMVEDVVQLMDHLKIQKAHVVGYSLGGIIVMRFMVEHPERVIDGTLGGMGWLKEGSVFQAAFERMSGGAGKTPPACVHGIGKLAVTEKEVMGVTVPVKIFVGDRDPCRRMYVEPLEKIRADWKVEVIDGAGHLNCIVKEQFKEGVVKWIGEAKGK